MNLTQHKNKADKRIGKSTALPILYMKATGKYRQAIHTLYPTHNPEYEYLFRYVTKLIKISCAISKKNNYASASGIQHSRPNPIVKKFGNVIMKTTQPNNMA
jgi:endonuclease V-like protein UPF0215 family